MSTSQSHPPVRTLAFDKWEFLGSLQCIENFIDLTFSTSPAHSQIVTLVLKTRRHELTFAEYRLCVETIHRHVENIRIEYCRRDWDCTGQHYTTGLDIIDRSVNHNGYEGIEFVFVVKHTISVDC